MDRLSRYLIAALSFILLGSLSVIVSGECDAGWHQLNEKCYHVETGLGSNPKASWYDARAWCQEHGGDLAAISSQTVRNLTYELAHQADYYEGSLWIGLSRAADYSTWRWVDGSILHRSGWHQGQPSNDRTRHCAHQSIVDYNTCFEQTGNKSYVIGLVEWPHTRENFTFLFDDVPASATGCEECEMQCRDNRECDAYTYHFSTFPHSNWALRCMGKSKYLYMPWDGYRIDHVCGGKKVDCPDNGDWFNDNCGIRRGYICEKPVTGTMAPPVVTTTVAVDGYCPRGYYGIGNKCFYVSEYDPDHRFTDGGNTWLEALDKCRHQPGVKPDLASFHSEQEMAEVAMHLFGDRISFWIGLYREHDYSHWVWSDNTPTDFSKFKSNPTSWGSEACVEMGTVPGPIGAWEAVDCSLKKGFICQTYKDPSMINHTPYPTTPSAVTCSSGQVTFWDSCYQVLGSQKSWDAAEADCVNIGGHLASMRDGAENYAMLHHFGGNYPKLWIGIKKEVDGVWAWSDTWDVAYVNWAGGQPDRTSSCAVIDSTDGKWNSVECSQNAYPLCKITQASPPTHPPVVYGDCPTEDWIHYAGHCYFFSGKYESALWDDAEQACVDMGTAEYESHLTSIHSTKENEFVFGQIKKTASFTEMAWIGLREYNEVLRWSDDSAVQFELFAPGEPNSDNGDKACANILTSRSYKVGYWAMNACAKKSRYVCKADKKEIPTIPPPEGCPRGSTGYGSSCFWLLDANPANYKTYFEAENECSKYGGMSVHGSANMNRQVAEHVAIFLPNKDDEVWIGLTRDHHDITKFHWADGSTSFTYNEWDVDRGEPRKGENLDCVYMMPATGKWRMGNCVTNRRPVLCTSIPGAIPPGTTTRMTTHHAGSTTTSASTIGSPEAQTGGRMSQGATVGVVLGVIAVVALLGIGGWFGYQKCRVPKQDETSIIAGNTQFTNPISYSNTDPAAEGKVDIGQQSGYTC